MRKVYRNKGDEMNISQKNYKDKQKELGTWGFHRGNRTMQSKRYREKHPEHDKAHRAVEGKPKNNFCQSCKKIDENTVRHHPDYSMPNLTKELCQACHNKLHLKGGE